MARRVPTLCAEAPSVLCFSDPPLCDGFSFTVVIFFFCPFGVLVVCSRAEHSFFPSLKVFPSNDFPYSILVYGAPLVSLARFPRPLFQARDLFSSPSGSIPAGSAVPDQLFFPLMLVFFLSRSATFAGFLPSPDRLPLPPPFFRHVTAFLLFVAF